jgi:hypothetical protein
MNLHSEAEVMQAMCLIEAHLRLLKIVLTELLEKISVVTGVLPKIEGELRIIEGEIELLEEAFVSGRAASKVRG